MIANQLKLAQLPRILSDKPILEHFLRILLDKPIRLSDWPEETAWDDTSPVPDLQALTIDGTYICLYVNLFGCAPLVSELAYSATKLCTKPVCSIVLTDADPVELGQSYSRIAPMVVDAPVITELDCSWQIHILSCSEDIVNHNAPSGIQQLLDHLAGQNHVPVPGSLLDEMLQVEFAYCWLDAARFDLKKKWREKQDVLVQKYASCWHDFYMRNYSQGFLEGYSNVDIYNNLLKKLIDSAKTRDELMASCQAAHIPLEMLLDYVTGNVWTQEDVFQWHQQARTKETTHRRSRAAR